MSEQALLFDSHCHLDDRRFDEDRDGLIAGLSGRGIFACLSCGSDAASSRASLALARRWPFVWAAAGIHPHEASQAGEEDFAEIGKMLREDKVRALGEAGLDFHYDFSPRDTQERVLLRQLDMAYEAGFPIVLHVREAHGAMLDILNRRAGRLPGGVLHCFSGSAESAAEYQRLGFHISFAGSVTFRNAGKLRMAAQAVRAERLLIETDSPYLAPEPFRGRRNDPSQVCEVCRVLAEVRGVSYGDIADQTLRNACALFGVPAPEDSFRLA